MSLNRQSPGSIYKGSVMHARLKPVGHRFQYTVFSLLLDLDQLSIATQSSVLSHNRFNLLSFHDKDHGPRDGSDLRTYVNEVLQEVGMQAPEKIELLCYPRILGWVFNPLSVYYCFDAEGTLSALIYEVRNTFGERHTYVAPIGPGELVGDRVRQSRDKVFYVSPFVEMEMRYNFRLTVPDERLTLRILEEDSDGPLLSATFSGERLQLSTGNLLAAFVQVPLQTLKIVGGIHWEALRLWFKGVKFNKRPAPPPLVSFGDKQEFSNSVAPQELRS